jgi:hypothetical protein
VVPEYLAETRAANTARAPLAPQSGRTALDGMALGYDGGPQWDIPTTALESRA